jgi:hypothetical protein
MWLVLQDQHGGFRSKEISVTCLNALAARQRPGNRRDEEHGADIDFHQEVTGNQIKNWLLRCAPSRTALNSSRCSHSANCSWCEGG